MSVHREKNAPKLTESNTNQANRDCFATTNYSPPVVSYDTTELNVNELAKLAGVSSIG